MAIFKKTVFGLNVVGPQGVNAVNDFIVGETEEGETGVLVGEALLTTSGLKTIDDDGDIKIVPVVPDPEDVGDPSVKYQLTAEGGVMSWQEAPSAPVIPIPVMVTVRSLANSPQANIVLNGRTITHASIMVETTSPWVFLMKAGDTIGLQGVSATDYDDTPIQMQINLQDIQEFPLEEDGGGTYSGYAVIPSSGDSFQIIL